MSVLPWKKTSRGILDVRSERSSDDSARTTIIPGKGMQDLSNGGGILARSHSRCVCCLA
jgi:hypothetical protein